MIEFESEIPESSPAENSFVFENMSKSNTDIIAPVDAMATNPKLSFSDALLSFFNFDIPTDRDKINGTASIPVVAPEASKDIAKNSRDAKIANPKMIKYKAKSTLYKGTL